MRMLACERVYVSVFVCYTTHKKLLKFHFILIHLIFAGAYLNPSQRLLAELVKLILGRRGNSLMTVAIRFI